MAASRDLGEFIRELRNDARISLRQLAQRAGVSNPYLSQIERGLRKPSAEVLQQIANALRVSTPLMYLRAGLLAEREGKGVLAAIAADPDLTDRHKKTLVEIYEAFRRENARARGESAEETSGEAYDSDAELAWIASDSASDVPDTAVPNSTESVPSEAAAKPARPAAKRVVRKSVKKAVRKSARSAAKRAADAPETSDQKEQK
ncbi:MAG: helix-turn-helix domain-containing protein [Micromonosporaceae bacterium]|nr:helix-turn-helix domain-containing protein [Micromonosporaceae bacterium]